MPKPNTPRSSEHPTDLLLSFLGDSLAPAEKARVLNHIENCEECSTELKDLQEMAATLGLNKEAAFCPEPWELCEFVHTGKDPSGRFAGHLAQCDFCREEADACRALPERNAMPHELWDRGKDLLPRPVPAQRSWESESLLVRLSRWRSSLLSLPALAAAAAAAILVVVVLFERNLPAPLQQSAPSSAASAKARTLLALSSARWDGSEHVRLMSPGQGNDGHASKPSQTSKSRIAILIFFQDLPHTFTQERIDRLYEATRPAADLGNRFSVIAPDELRSVVRKGGIKTGSTDEILRGLWHSLGVSEAVFITVAARDDKFDVEGELIDTRTSNVLQTKETKGIRESQLPLKVREVSALFY